MEQTKGITMLGLGPGDPRLLTREAWEIIQNSPEIYLRTKKHPTVDGFPKELEVNSFDAIYEEEADYTKVYARIVEEVLALGRRPEGAVYAVPGHPFVAESTCVQIWERANEENIPVRVVEGISFMEPTLSALGIDPFPQTTLVDAFDLVTAHHPPFPPNFPALVAQVYSPEIAGEIKITLMALYPDEHPVKLIHGAGTANSIVEDTILAEIDHSPHTNMLTSLLVPPLGENTSFEAFQELIAHLRAPDGCPWDREQTHQSLRTNILEETFEALEAIDEDDPEAMQEEFGDLLLQIVLQAQIAAEYGEFTMSDVIQGIHTKLVRRHPHVFGEENIPEAKDVIVNWERLKAQEREENHQPGKGLLDGIPIAMPALSVADAYQRRAARVGFDWPVIEDVIEKILEEIEEFRQAGTAEEKKEEFGDLLFAMANLARWLAIDPEAALRETNTKFRQRFLVIEEEARKMGKPLTDMTLEEMDEIWERAKGEKK